MEYVQKYWYIIAGILLLLFVASRNRGGANVQQIGGDNLGYAQIASAEREADEARRFGFIENVLNYDLARRGLQSQDELSRIGLSQQIDLAEIYAQSQSQALANQYSLAQLQANLQQSQFLSAQELQRMAIERAYQTQRRDSWLGAITTGLQVFLPRLLGSSVSGGSINLPRVTTPTTFPSGSWTFGF